jgi:uncharacterized protein (TIGR02266 family)
MSGGGDDEHRRHSRIPIRQRVWCEGDQLTLYVQALNVSEGGMFVRTASPPETGQRFRVSFTEGEEEVIAEVEVVWTRAGASDAQPGMGVRIVSFEKGEPAFRSWVDRHRATSDSDDGTSS